MVKTVIKPWGCEYLLYQNDNVAIWHLYIDAYQETSLHSHPNKKTGLIVLNGAAKVSFLDNDTKLFYGEKIMIRHGVFHKTKSMTDTTLQLLEIETPVNKEDIVRLEDNYGRAGLTSMGPDGFYIKELDIKDGHVGRCKIKFMTINEDYFEVYKNDFDNFMITSGNVSHNDYNIAGPGDIISYNNLKKLIEKFSIQANIEGIAVKTC